MSHDLVEIVSQNILDQLDMVDHDFFKSGRYVVLKLREMPRPEGLAQKFIRNLQPEVVASTHSALSVGRMMAHSMDEDIEEFDAAIHDGYRLLFSPYQLGRADMIYAEEILAERPVYPFIAREVSPVDSIFTAKRFYNHSRSNWDGRNAVVMELSRDGVTELFVPEEGSPRKMRAINKFDKDLII